MQQVLRWRWPKILKKESELHNKLKNWQRILDQNCVSEMRGKQSIDNDLKYSRICKDIAVNFCDCALTHHTSNGYPAKLAHNKAVEGNEDKYLCAGSNFLELKDNDRVIQIVGHDLFLEGWICEISRVFTDFSPELEEKKIQLLRDYLKKPKNKRKGFLKGFIRGRLPLVWITIESDYHSVVEKVERENLASELVETLALQFGKPTHLFEVKYPVKEAKKMLLKNPTFIDGGLGGLFLSPANTKEWGETSPLKQEKPGLKEAVSPPIMMSDDFDVEYIGKYEPKPNG